MESNKIPVQKEKPAMIRGSTVDIKHSKKRKLSSEMDEEREN